MYDNDVTETATTSTGLFEILANLIPKSGKFSKFSVCVVNDLPRRFFQAAVFPTPSQGFFLIQTSIVAIEYDARQVGLSLWQRLASNRSETFRGTRFRCFRMGSSGRRFSCLCQSWLLSWMDRKILLRPT